MLIHNCHITVDKSLGPSWKIFTSMTKKDKKSNENFTNLHRGLSILGPPALMDCLNNQSSLTITDHSLGLFRHAGGSYENDSLIPTCCTKALSF